MSDHEWRFLTKSSMALDGFRCTPKLGRVGNWNAQTFSLGDLESKQVMCSPVLVRPA